MNTNARCQNPKVAGHKTVFLWLIHVDFSTAKNKLKILARVFPKLYKLLTLNWLDGLISHGLTLRSQFSSEELRSVALEHTDN